MISSFVLSAAFMANLKSSLIKKSYEDKTETLDEIVDKDMFVYMDKAAADYLGAQGEEIPVNLRLLCQAQKYNSIYTGYENHNSNLIHLQLFIATIRDNFEHCKTEGLLRAFKSTQMIKKHTPANNTSKQGFYNGGGNHKSFGEGRSYSYLCGFNRRTERRVP